jgi:hypothetical protein
MIRGGLQKQGFGWAWVRDGRVIFAWEGKEGGGGGRSKLRSASDLLLGASDLCVRLLLA